MAQRRTAPSVADIGGEVAGLSAGLGILTTVLFPFALPLIILVVAPLALLGVMAAVLAAPVVAGIWLVRAARANRSERPADAGRRRAVRRQAHPLPS